MIRRIRFRKRLRAVAVISLMAGLILVYATIFALKWQPDWYKPPRLGREQVQEARLGATRIVDDIGDRLVERQPFEIVLSEHEVNAWLAALPQIWPDAAKSIPRELEDLVVHIQENSIWLAAATEISGGRTILACELRLSVTSDGSQVETQMTRAQCGRLPVPMNIVSRVVNPYMGKSAAPGTSPKSSSARISPRSVDDLLAGFRTRNRFIWPNGERPFRFERISIETSKVRLIIQPI